MNLLNYARTLFYGKKLYYPARFRVLASHPGSVSEVLEVVDRKSGDTLGLKLYDRAKLAQYRESFRHVDLPTEAEMLQQIRHPRVVQAVETGVAYDDRPFLLTGWMSGSPLVQVLRSDRFTPDPLAQAVRRSRVTVLRQAAQVLASVHKAGLLHRDVCPQNFILSEDGRSLSLIDFHLAVPNEDKLVSMGRRYLRPDYIAPEIARKQVSGAKLDVFAFGVVAYELCTGYLPWDSSERATTVERALQGAPDIRGVDPEIDPRLARAVMGCLITDPADRISSFEEFQRHLDGVQDPGTIASGVDPRQNPPTTRLSYRATEHP